MKNNWFIYIIIFLSFSSVLSYSQDSNFIEILDSIEVKSGEYIFINNKRTFINNDTIIYINDSTQIKIKNKNRDGNELYYKLKDKAGDKKVSNAIVDLLIKETHSRNHNKEQKSENDFIPYEGKIINNIYIKQLNVFGTSFSDTLKTATNWLGKKSNNLHINTREIFIKNKIIVKSGELIDPFIIADNERIIRKLPYIKDAKFIIAINKIDTNKVDILLLTKDLWSIGIEGNLSSNNSGYFEVYDKNLGGTGHTQTNLFEYDNSTQPLYGYEGSYFVPSLGNSFISNKLYYNHNDNNENYGFDISKKFITPETKFAGGVRVSEELWHEGYITDTLITIPPQNHYNKNIWFGYSYKLNRKTNSSYRNNLFMIIQHYDNDYNFNQTGYDSTLKYIDNNNSLISFGFTQKAYYKSSLINSFGKTEDIPYGKRFQIFFGKEHDIFGTRFCGGLEYAYARFTPNLGYFYYSVKTGSYIKDKSLEQSGIIFNIKYFSQLFSIFSIKSRQFISVNYINGINRRPYEQLTLNNNIRQFSLNQVSGTKKFNFIIENVLFTPVNFYGFKMAFFSFWDCGVIGDYNNFITDNKYYSGIGCGLRIKNDNLVFNTFEIKFVYYPVAPNNHSNTFLHIANTRQFKFDELMTSPPNLDNFK